MVGGVHYSEAIMNLAPRDNDPPRGSFVSRNNDSKCRTRELGSFVSNNNDSKCRNMVDGCHLSLAKGRRGSFDIRF